jgi:hypothetical protein
MGDYFIPRSPCSSLDHLGRKSIAKGWSSFDAGKSDKIGELPKGKVGPLAQLVEQRTFNPWVDGSSPSGPTLE